MLAGCGSSSRSQTDNTESSSSEWANSSSASETADATEDSENTETTESTDTSETQKHLHQQKPMIPLRQLLQMIRNLQEKLWLYIILQQELLKELQTIADTTGGDLFEIQPVEPIQMMIWTGQMIVVYPENMMKV